MSYGRGESHSCGASQYEIKWRMQQGITCCLYRQPKLKCGELPQKLLALKDSPALECTSCRHAQSAWRYTEPKQRERTCCETKRTCFQTEGTRFRTARTCIHTERTCFRTEGTCCRTERTCCQTTHNKHFTSECSFNNESHVCCMLWSYNHAFHMLQTTSSWGDLTQISPEFYHRM